MEVSCGDEGSGAAGAAGAAVGAGEVAAEGRTKGSGKSSEGFNTGTFVRYSVP